MIDGEGDIEPGCTSGYFLPPIKYPIPDFRVGDGGRPELLAGLGIHKLRVESAVRSTAGYPWYSYLLATWVYRRASPGVHLIEKFGTAIAFLWVERATFAPGLTGVIGTPHRTRASKFPLDVH